jgi:hypothetical protein
MKEFNKCPATGTFNNEQHSINVYEPEVPKLNTMGNSHTNFKI